LSLDWPQSLQLIQAQCFGAGQWGRQFADWHALQTLTLGLGLCGRFTLRPALRAMLRSRIPCIAAGRSP